MRAVTGLNMNPYHHHPSPYQHDYGNTGGGGGRGGKWSEIQFCSIIWQQKEYGFSETMLGFSKKWFFKNACAKI